MKQLYVIDYENAHWCGGQLHCVVWAESEYEAEELASYFMFETQYELFSSEYEEEASDECVYTVNSVELLEGSEHEVYYNDPIQRKNFYPCVNLPQ